MKKNSISNILLMLLLSIFSLNVASCSKQETSLNLIDESDENTEYLSFFSSNDLTESDAGKYWSEHFAKTYEKNVYVNYDGAAYYEDTGITYRDLLEKRLKSSQPDDLYIINAEDVLSFEKKGYWKDLSGLNFINNLSDAALYQSTYNGKVFSLPLEFTGFGFCWNISLLEKYDLSMPTNMNEFMEVCATLKKNGITPYGANKGYALTVPAMCKGLASLYQSDTREQKIAALNTGKTKISSYMKDGFQFLEELKNKEYFNVDQAINTIPADEEKDFKNEKYAFICTSLSKAYEIAKECDFKTMMSGIPVLNDGMIAVYGTGSRLCINPKSKNLDTAIKFLEMVGTKDALDYTASLNHTISSAKDSNVQVLGMQSDFAHLLSQPGQIPNQDFALHFNTWINIRDVGKELCEGISVEEACKKLDELQKKELKEYKGD